MTKILCGDVFDGAISQMCDMRLRAMRIISGNSLKTLLLILMIILYSSSLIRILSVLIIPYQGGTDRVVIGSIWVFRMYVAMYRNPDNGTEIQNYACRRSGIMTQAQDY